MVDREVFSPMVFVTGGSKKGKPVKKKTAVASSVAPIPEQSNADNPFAAIGDRTPAPGSLFKRQVGVVMHYCMRPPRRCCAWSPSF